MYTLNAHNNPSGNLKNPKFLTIIHDLEYLGLTERFEAGIKIISTIEPFAEAQTKVSLSSADIILGQLHLVLYCKQPDQAQKDLLSMLQNGEINLKDNYGAPFRLYTYLGESDPYGLLLEFLDAKGF